jgi:hypothetical protein
MHDGDFFAGAVPLRTPKSSTTGVGITPAILPAKIVERFDRIIIVIMTGTVFGIQIVQRNRFPALFLVF